MKTFDLIVLGGGTGLDIAARAASEGKQVALIEPGALGGTCLNRGCIPSKMLIHTANIISQLKQSSDFGIDSKIQKINFSKIINRVLTSVDHDALSIARAVESDKNITWFKNTGKFIGRKLIQVGDEKISADKIVIAVGTRPFIPNIKGLDEVNYITSKEALRLTTLPKSMIIVGGGYISAELAYFYKEMGVEITIIEEKNFLLAHEDKDISEKFTEIFSQEVEVVLGVQVVRVSKHKKGVEVFVQNKVGDETSYIAETLFLATGRVSNADMLNIESVGYKLTTGGYIDSNANLETQEPGVFVLGDVAGKYFFKHSANHEAGYVWNNLWKEVKTPVDYTAIPHAVFTNPQIASVGKTEQELIKEGITYKIGREEYKNTGMGQALLEKDGFVKVLLSEDDLILGCHIIGPEASSLIHEVVVAMKSSGARASAIREAVHIHPALNEVVQRAFYKIQKQG